MGPLGAGLFGVPRGEQEDPPRVVRRAGLVQSRSFYSRPSQEALNRGMHALCAVQTLVLREEPLKHRRVKARHCGVCVDQMSGPNE